MKLIGRQRFSRDGGKRSMTIIETTVNLGMYIVRTGVLYKDCIE